METPAKTPPAKIPTDADKAWAEIVEDAAKALAQHASSDCFGPLRDDEEHRLIRNHYRNQACIVLDAVAHRGCRNELDRIDALLHEHGFEYPLGFRGVQGLANQYMGRLADPEWLAARLAALEP